MAAARAEAVKPAAKRPARDGDFRAVAKRWLAWRAAEGDETVQNALKLQDKLLQKVKLDVKLDVLLLMQEEQQSIELRLELLDLSDQWSERLREVENERKRRWRAERGAPNMSCKVAAMLQAKLAAAAPEAADSNWEAD